MQIVNYQYINDWNLPLDYSLDSESTLIIIFSCLKPDVLISPLEEIRQKFPRSLIIGSSTAGQLVNDEIDDDSISVSVIKFERTRLKLTTLAIEESNSFDAGVKTTSKLLEDDLKSIFLLSDGLVGNGTQLTNGINSVLPNQITVTGGLAADTENFEETWILVDDKPKKDFISMVGFYGDHINVSHGSKSGLDKLGLLRTVTKSKGNILYEVDGLPALELYKKYLGPLADGLPATGLMFPLELTDEGNAEEPRVRTLFAVNEEDNSMTFVDDIPQGSYARLMKANVDRMIDGSVGAAQKLNFEENQGEPILVIAVSCFARRLVLKQRTEEELEGNLGVFPKNAQQIGFYSFGEISSNYTEGGECCLFNQTITLTSFWESNA